MSKKFSFTKEDLDKLVVEALKEEETPEKGAVKPNVMQMLMNKAKLRGQGEHGTESV